MIGRVSLLLYFVVKESLVRPVPVAAWLAQAENGAESPTRPKLHKTRLRKIGGGRGHGPLRAGGAR